MRNNSSFHGAGENNLLPLQTIINNQSDEASVCEADRTSLLSPTNNNQNVMNISQNSASVKCYFHHEHNCFLDYLKDQVLDDTVIYMSDVPFQYNKIESRYTGFIGNLTGTTLLATKRDQEILLGQRNNTSNMSGNSNNFRQLSANEECSNLTQMVPATPSDTSHPTYNAPKRDPDEEYFSRVKIELSSCMGSTNFVDHISLRKVHELMKHVRNTTIQNNNKHKVQLKPFYFE